LASKIEPKKRKFTRRMMTLIYFVITAVVIATLLAYERIDVLYILATLGLVVLLLIVAFADLEGRGKEIPS
jgi:cell division protein FtsW (lipid II flippase)